MLVIFLISYVYFLYSYSKLSAFFCTTHGAKEFYSKMRKIMKVKSNIRATLLLLSCNDDIIMFMSVSICSQDTKATRTCHKSGLSLYIKKIPFFYKVPSVISYTITATFSKEYLY